MISKPHNPDIAAPLFAGWDAQNKGSVALAEKSGYHYSHTYTAYEMQDSPRQSD